MLNKLATLFSITAVLPIMLFIAVQSAHTSSQPPITVEGDVVTSNGILGEHGGRVTIGNNLGAVLSDTETAPTAVTISHTSVLHASTVVPLLFIASAFFLTGATLFGMSLFPPVPSYTVRGNRYGVT